MKTPFAVTILTITTELLFFSLISSRMEAQSSQPVVAPAASLSQRGLKIVVASDAPAVVTEAASDILTAVNSNVLLSTMSGSKPPAGLTDSTQLIAGPVAPRAMDNLILVGLPSDPMIAAAWQREARQESNNGLYIFGFGHLSGDIGYIESDRNPFLHSAAIKSAPYETEVITITGSDAAGVALAAHEFVEKGLTAGVVAAPGWTRPRPNLLERDPLSPQFDSLTWVPNRAGDATRIGLIQASEDEYRGVLADAGVEPDAIWRVKYYRSGAWDGVGAISAYDDYSNGLHRRAYGNTLWCCKFDSSEQSAAAAPKIAAAAALRRLDSGHWSGNQPPYGFQTESSGPLFLWYTGKWVFMSTLPKEETAQLTNISPP